MSQHRGAWKNRWTFMLATAGSAIGLGNIWKLPYMIGVNGGSAFVLVHWPKRPMFLLNGAGWVQWACWLAC